MAAKGYQHLRCLTDYRIEKNTGQRFSSEMFRGLDTEHVRYVGLLHLSKMTALQELSIVDCQAIKAEDMVHNLKSLITQHSLARIKISAQMMDSLPASGRQLPCTCIKPKQGFSWEL